MSATTTRDSLEPLAGRVWRRACAVQDIPEDEGLVLSTVPKTSVFHSEGELYCIDDTCTHEDFSLADGWVEGCVVECTLHAAKFDLRSGAPLTPPASRPVATHPVTRMRDDVFVALPDTYLVKEVGDGLA
ncbi:bifunctional 3-phenylpropionate/cinnamic acid dioxygenase ferredoxin subunit [Actinoplanes sp. CA-131856]